jgi:hypothetical protein
LKAPNSKPLKLLSDVQHLSPYGVARDGLFKENEHLRIAEVVDTYVRLGGETGEVGVRGGLWVSLRMTEGAVSAEGAQARASGMHALADACDALVAAIAACKEVRGRVDTRCFEAPCSLLWCPPPQALAPAMKEGTVFGLYFDILVGGPIPVVVRRRLNLLQRLSHAVHSWPFFRRVLAFTTIHMDHPGRLGKCNILCSADSEAERGCKFLLGGRSELLIPYPKNGAAFLTCALSYTSHTGSGTGCTGVLSLRWLNEDGSPANCGNIHAHET